MVPMVICDDNQTPPLYDSSEILKQFCPFLYPQSCVGEIDELEELFDSKLGPSVRCIIYHEYLVPQYMPSLAKLATNYSSRIEAALFTIMLRGGLDKGLKKAMGINDASAKLSEETIKSIFAQVSDKLSDRREYLCDEKNRRAGFTAADLSFAALASPIIMPKELLSLYDDHKKMPPRLLSLSKELRDTPAGQHVLTMYHKHRFGVGAMPRCSTKKCDNSPTSIRVVVPKSIQRNRIPWVGIGVLGIALAASVGAVRSKL